MTMHLLGMLAIAYVLFGREDAFTGTIGLTFLLLLSLAIRFGLIFAIIYSLNFIEG